MIAICEIDDYPRGNLEELFESLDEAKKLNPNFKVTLFAIPYELTEETYLPIKQREQWIHLGVHGWRHEKFESYFPSSRDGYAYARRQLKRTLKKPYEFSKIFKPRSYGYSWPLIEALRLEGFVISLRNKYDLLHGHHLYHKWFPNLETNVGVRATLLDNKDIKILYGHTIEEEPDYFPRFYEKKYRRKIEHNNYEWKFSEEVALWV